MPRVGYKTGLFIFILYMIILSYPPFFIVLFGVGYAVGTWLAMPKDSNDEKYPKE